MFFNVEKGREERVHGTSMENHEEVKLIVTLLNGLFHKYAAVTLLKSFGLLDCCTCCTSRVTTRSIVRIVEIVRIVRFAAPAVLLDRHSAPVTDTVLRTTTVSGIICTHW